MIRSDCEMLLCVYDLSVCYCWGILAVSELFSMSYVTRVYECEACVRDLSCVCVISSYLVKLEPVKLTELFEGKLWNWIKGLKINLNHCGVTICPLLCFWKVFSSYSVAQLVGFKISILYQNKWHLACYFLLVKKSMLWNFPVVALWI